MVGSSIGQFIDTALQRAVDNAVEKAVKNAVESSVDKIVEQVFSKFLERLCASGPSNNISRTVNEQTRDQYTESKWAHIQNYPCPGYKYEIQIAENEDRRLGSDENSLSVFMYGCEGNTDDEENKFGWWKCVEAQGWLCFQNMGTGRYLGVNDEQSPRSGLVVVVTYNQIVKETKFCLRRVYRNGREGYMLQSLVRGRLYPLEIFDKFSCYGQHDLAGIRIVCDEEEEAGPEEWSLLVFKVVL